MIKDIGKRILRTLGNYRQEEYKQTLAMMEECSRILDAGCGTGTFLEACGNRACGIDINPDNIQYCLEKGLNAVVGSVLEIPFDAECFDGVHCSHVMQVFGPDEAARMIRELGRVTKPGGVIVISTLNWFPHFFRHPENVRPYPPDALWRYFAMAQGASSPMYPNMPRLSQEAIWLRHPPLVELFSSTSKNIDGLSSIINMIQYRICFRKYWRYNSYTVKLRRTEIT